MSTEHIASAALNEDRAALWNPSGVLIWSLAFSPAFGAWLHVRNCEAMGDLDAALTARRWLAASIGVLAVQALVRALETRLNSESGFTMGLGLAYTLVWMVGAALPHAAAVRTRFGAAYPRRQWDAPLFLAVLAGTVYFIGRALFTALLLAST